LTCSGVDLSAKAGSTCRVRGVFIVARLPLSQNFQLRGLWGKQCSQHFSPRYVTRSRCSRASHAFSVRSSCSRVSRVSHSQSVLSFNLRPCISQDGTCMNRPIECNMS
jgi:hypothetical protein